MAGMKGIHVALLVDVVASRSGSRSALHKDLLATVEEVNDGIGALDPLRPTVADELQGVYASVGDALAASFHLRLALAPRWSVRFGIGGGEVETIDAERGIQDGSAWWLAREAINWAEELSTRKGYESVRTAIRDERPEAVPSTDAVVRLVDSALHRLRPGAVNSLKGLLAGEDNAEVARRESISESANSQRVINNDLRVLADAIEALSALP